MIITLDMGTTNTRLRLFDGEALKDSIKLSMGAGTTNKEGNDFLRRNVKKTLDEILERNNLTQDKIKNIVASGMAGSELGLYNIKHIMLPADTAKLREKCEKVMLEDICSIPFIFIPGAKNHADYSDISDVESMDIMRGEETEVTGIINMLGEKGPLTVILPGSHNKIIHIDKQNRISDFVTTMSGEITKAMVENTILKSSVDFCDNLDEEYLIKGYEISKNMGFNAAAFKIRIMSLNFNLTQDKLMSFLTGAVLCDDIEIIKKNAEGKILVGGSDPLRKAFGILLKDFDTKIISDEQAELCVSEGARAIAVDNNMYN